MQRVDTLNVLLSAGEIQNDYFGKAIKNYDKDSLIYIYWHASITSFFLTKQANRSCELRKLLCIKTTGMIVGLKINVCELHSARVDIIPKEFVALDHILNGEWNYFFSADK